MDSAHAAGLWFSHKVRNTGTEYAREIANLAFSLYIGDDPNPAYTYFVAPDLGGDGMLHNFMLGETHPYTSRRIPLTLEQMKAIDLGAPISVPVGKEVLGRVVHVIGEPVDFHNASIVNEEVHLLDFWPEPGRYTLRLECVGRNPASQGYYLGIESVRLRERRPRVSEYARDRDKDWRKEPVLYR